MLEEYSEIEASIHKLLIELLNEHEHFIVRCGHILFTDVFIFLTRRDLVYCMQSLCDAKEAAFTMAQEQRDEKHDTATRSLKSACKGEFYLEVSSNTLTSNFQR